MAELFNNARRVVQVLERSPPATIPTSSTAARWALVVVRANGVEVEVLPELYENEIEADQQRVWHQSRWQNVEV